MEIVKATPPNDGEPKTEVTKEASQTITEPANTQPADNTKSDLLKRVSEYQLENDTNLKTEAEIDKDFFSDPELRGTIDKIEDPALKEQMMSLRKSIISGGNQKFQDMASLRKRMEALEGNGQKPAQEKWTVDRIHQLATTDPEFIEAAKQYGGTTGTETGLDYASENEKALMSEMTTMKKDMADMRNQNKQSMSTQQQAYYDQQHALLKDKYSDYNPEAISTTMNAMLEKKQMAVNPGESIFESVYKASHYDKNMEKAYKMGREDERAGKDTTPPAISGVSTSSSEPAIVQDKDESRQSVMARIVEKGLKSLHK